MKQKVDGFRRHLQFLRNFWMLMVNKELMAIIRSWIIQLGSTQNVTVPKVPFRGWFDSTSYTWACVGVPVELL